MVPRVASEGGIRITFVLLWLMSLQSAAEFSLRRKEREERKSWTGLQQKGAGTQWLINGTFWSWFFLLHFCTFLRCFSWGTFLYFLNSFGTLERNKKVWQDSSRQEDVRWWMEIFSLFHQPLPSHFIPCPSEAACHPGLIQCLKYHPDNPIICPGVPRVQCAWVRPRPSSQQQSRV